MPVKLASLAGPGCEEQEQAGVAHRSYLVALVRVEDRQHSGTAALGLAVGLELDLAVDDHQPCPLVDLVVCEALPLRELDGDRPSLLVAVEDLGAVHVYVDGA